MEKFKSVDEFEKRALQMLKPKVGNYISSLRSDTWSRSQEALKKLRIRPRMLINTDVDLSTTILGQTISMPVGVAPIAFQQMVHSHGEWGSAKAAEMVNTIFIKSATTQVPVLENLEIGPKWFEIFFSKRESDFTFTMETAESQGYKALVVTVDSPFELTNEKLKEISADDDIFYNNIRPRPITPTESVQDPIFSMLTHSRFPNFVWKDINWLKKRTSLPLVVKGIMTEEDALQCVKYGVNAIMVSNRGGRHTSAPIEVLPEIVKAVDGKVEVYLDDDLKEGVDVFRALALGAKMVFIGKPLIWGLTCGGERGVKRIFDILKDQLTDLFELTGCSTVKDVIRNTVVIHESKYNNI